MTSLSAILAEIEVSAEKVKQLEDELASETQRRRALVEQYGAQSSDALRSLGIEMVRKRKERSQLAILMSAAGRSIRQSHKGGEKNPKAVLAVALDAAEKVAKGKLGLTEVPSEIRAKIEERAKTPAKK
jgi:hypothetical protein